MRKKSGHNKITRKPRPKHWHRWVGSITFKCQCGATHRDQVYVARHGYLFITHYDED